VGARRCEASFGVAASAGSALNYSQVKVLLQSCDGAASKELRVMAQERQVGFSSGVAATRMRKTENKFRKGTVGRKQRRRCVYPKNETLDQ
jgi:hypothetical protein